MQISNLLRECYAKRHGNEASLQLRVNGRSWVCPGATSWRLIETNFFLGWSEGERRFPSHLVWYLEGSAPSHAGRLPLSSETKGKLISSLQQGRERRCLFRIPPSFAEMKLTPFVALLALAAVVAVSADPVGKLFRFRPKRPDRDSKQQDKMSPLEGRDWSILGTSSQGACSAYAIFVGICLRHCTHTVFFGPYSFLGPAGGRSLQQSGSSALAGASASSGSNSGFGSYSSANAVATALSSGSNSNAVATALAQSGRFHFLGPGKACCQMHRSSSSTTRQL